MDNWKYFTRYWSHAFIRRAAKIRDTRWPINRRWTSITDEASCTHQAHTVLPIQCRMPNGIFEFLLCVAIQPRYNGTQNDYWAFAQLRVRRQRKCILRTWPRGLETRISRNYGDVNCYSRLTVVYREKLAKDGNFVTLMNTSVNFPLWHIYVSSL